MITLNVINVVTMCDAYNRVIESETLNDNEKLRILHKEKSKIEGVLWIIDRASICTDEDYDVINLLKKTVKEIEARIVVLKTQV